MAEYRTVRMAFWNDPFVECLEVGAKLLYLYLFTCPYANNLGVIEVTRKKIAFETGLSVQDVDRHLADFARDGKVITDGSLIWMTNFIKNQCSTSPKLVGALRALIPSIASEKIRHEVCLRYPHIFDEDTTVLIPSPYPIDTVPIPSGELESGILNLEKEGEERGDTSPTPAPAAKPSSSRQKKAEPPKTSYGEYQRVKLTADEYARLEGKFGADTLAAAITKLDLHIEAKGKDEYKCHAAAMQKWVFAAVEQDRQRGRASPSAAPSPPNPVDPVQDAAKAEAVQKAVQRVQNEAQRRAMDFLEKGRTA